MNEFQMFFLFFFFFYCCHIVETRVSNTERSLNLRDSWSKSVKQMSLSNDSPKAIDAFGIDTNETTANKDDSKKKAVPARNNWSMDLVDVDSDSEQDSVVSESVGEETSDEEYIANEYIDADHD